MRVFRDLILIAWTLCLLAHLGVLIQAQTPNDQAGSADALAKQQTERLNRLIVALGDRDWSTAEKAAKELGDLKDTRAVEPLIAALHALGRSLNHWNVQRAAATALGKIKDPRAVRPLIEALRSRQTRSSAATALGEIRDPQAIDPLFVVLQDEPAATALGSFGEPVVQRLIARLNDKNWEVRANAATASLTCIVKVNVPRRRWYRRR